MTNPSYRVLVNYICHHFSTNRHSECEKIYFVNNGLSFHFGESFGFHGILICRVTPYGLRMLDSIEPSVGRRETRQEVDSL